MKLEGNKATIRDVANWAGVSVVTVSRVINRSGIVSDETRRAVEAAIKELDYVPNVFARGLRRGRSNLLALVITNILNPFWTTLARGVEDRAAENGLSVILCNTDNNIDDEREYLTVLLQQQVDGMIVAPAMGDGTNLSLLSKRGVPYVMIDRRAVAQDGDIVLCDNIAPAYRLTKHLIDQGHRRIAIIVGPKEVSTARERFIGYLEALEESGIAAVEALIKRGAPNDQKTGYDLTMELLSLEEPPTALFVADNLVCIGTIVALREGGVQVPGDVSLASFDEISQYADAYPFLTVANQPAYEMGVTATELLLERLSGARTDNKEVLLEAQILLRQSSSESGPQVAHKTVSRNSRPKGEALLDGGHERRWELSTEGE